MTLGAASPSQPRRRVGRPRIDARPITGDPTDEILGAAARLFGAQGINGTTMSRIAAEVGLKQSSLYYHFRSKDDVVAALMERANVVPLTLAQRAANAPDPVPVQLFRFVKGDVEALCALPFDINEVHRIAARDVDRFATYWDERRILERLLAGIVRRGIAAGLLRPKNARLTALTILANDEGVQNWYRLGTSVSRSKIATYLADLTVAGLLTTPHDLATLASAAAAADRRDR